MWKNDSRQRQDVEWLDDLSKQYRVRRYRGIDTRRANIGLTALYK